MRTIIRFMYIVESVNVSQMAGFLDTMYAEIQKCAPNGTFADAVEAFLIDLGITQTELDSIRALMLEAE